MLYYRVKPEHDNKRRMKYGKYGGLVCDGVYIANELFTEREMKAEYHKHLVGIPPEELFDRVEIPKSRTYWMFGVRKEMA